MAKKFYIDDFVEDLNYRNIILYIGDVDKEKLYDKLVADYVNHTNRFEDVLEKSDPSMALFMYIANCDLQDLDYPVYEYLEEGYVIAPLRFDRASSRYYINIDMNECEDWSRWDQGRIKYVKQRKTCKLSKTTQ